MDRLAPGVNALNNTHKANILYFQLPHGRSQLTGFADKIIPDSQGCLKGYGVSRIYLQVRQLGIKARWII